MPSFLHEDMEPRAKGVQAHLERKEVARRTRAACESTISRGPQNLRIGVDLLDSVEVFVEFLERTDRDERMASTTTVSYCMDRYLRFLKLCAQHPSVRKQKHFAVLKGFPVLSDNLRCCCIMSRYLRRGA